MKRVLLLLLFLKEICL